MVPFDPKTIEEHKLRWPEAIRKVWDYRPYRKRDPQTLAQLDGPGKHPEHIFDFPDGLRLIVSTDQYDDTGAYLHVSASISRDTPMWQEFATATTMPTDFRTRVQVRVAALGGPAVTLGYVSNDKGVPHLFAPPLSSL